MPRGGGHLCTHELSLAWPPKHQVCSESALAGCSFWGFPHLLHRQEGLSPLFPHSIKQPSKDSQRTTQAVRGIDAMVGTAQTLHLGYSMSFLLCTITIGPDVVQGCLCMTELVL